MKKIKPIVDVVLILIAIMVSILFIDCCVVDAAKTTSIFQNVTKSLAEFKMSICKHEFGDFELIIAPIGSANGVEKRICHKCNFEDEREYVCRHENVSIAQSVEATCANSGFEKYACDLCRTVMKTISYAQLPCTFGDWKLAKYATPFEHGEMHRTCSECGRVDIEYTTMEMAGEDSIYIPGTPINHEVYVGGFVQSNVDRHDILYSTNVWGRGKNNPFVLGHNYGTMQHISMVEVGQYIYLSIDGEIEVYEVVVSEFAMQNYAWTDIIGQTTNASVWDSVGEKTLHMYTCYGENKNGRWLVLAKLV